MFARNEKVYGVHSNFEEDLSQYTIQLERRDSAEFKYTINFDSLIPFDC